MSTSHTANPGGKCGPGETKDLLLIFAVKPNEWLDAGELPTEPCAVTARPLDDGRFEIRLSYAAPGPGREFQFLTFQTAQGFVVDHWLVAPAAPVARKARAAKSGLKPDKAASKIASSAGDVVPPGSAEAPAALSELDFDNQSSWEKILGSAVVALDFNSPELDRFRAKGLERASGLSPDPIEIRPLKLPLLDLPPMDNDLEFSERAVKFGHLKAVTAEGEEAPEPGSRGAREREAYQQGLNFAALLANQGEWLKAQKAIDIVERSSLAEKFPPEGAQWSALKGYVYLKLGRRLKDPLFGRKALEIWGDGVRKFAGNASGDQQPYVEFMALETIRNLFKQNLPYPASALLSWTRRFSWSSGTDERFAYLRAEAFYRLGMQDEAKALFEEFVTTRQDLPVTALADRRLLTAAGFRLGDLQLRLGNYRAAIEAYTRAFVSAPKARKFSFEGNWLPDDVRYFPYVLFNRAEAFTRLGREDAALRDLRAFLFVAPTDADAGLVYYRIGDLLHSLGGAGDKAQGTWRECVFRVSESVGGRLCAARLSAQEMLKGDRAKWPRLIAGIEDAGKLKGAGESAPRADDLTVYLNLMLADAFLTLKEPYQALVRTDGVSDLEPTPYLKAWWMEYSAEALTGYGARLVREGRYRQVVSDYESRRKKMFLGQTRAGVLKNLADAYRGLELWDESMTTLNTAEAVRDRVGRKQLRPYDPTPESWVFRRADLETEMLARKRPGIDAAQVRARLNQLTESDPENQRLWLRYSQVIGDAAAEAKWWAKLEQSSGLDWPQVSRYSEVLKELRQDAARAELLERRVGAWFGERERIASASPPPVRLLFALFETRALSPRRERALTVIDYLYGLDDKNLDPDITAPMIAYRRGRLAQEMERWQDARQSFARAKQLAPDSVWGKLATSSEKRIREPARQP